MGLVNISLIRHKRTSFKSFSIVQLDFIKLENVCIWKDTTYKDEKASHRWEETICKTHVDRELGSRMYEELLKLQQWEDGRPPQNCPKSKPTLHWRRCTDGKWAWWFKSKLKSKWDATLYEVEHSKLKRIITPSIGNTEKNRTPLLC